MKIVEKIKKIVAGFLVTQLIFMMVPAAVTDAAATNLRRTIVSSSTIVGWDFTDQNQTADSGVVTNSSKTITSVGTGVYTYSGGPTGAGLGDYAISTTNWNNGDYWEVEFDASGYTDLYLSSDQRSSSTGPKNFQVDYSLDGSTWTTVGGSTYTLVSDNWYFLSGLSLPSTVNRQGSVYLRWIATADASGSAGTNRIDNITVTGTPNQAPSIPALSSPSDTSFTNSNAVTLSWGASTDTESDSINYELTVDGTVVTRADNSLTSENLSSLSEGTHDWSVRSYDPYNYSVPSSTWSFTVDTVNPIISNQSASNQQFSPGVVDGAKDTTDIQYTLSEDAKVTINIYDDTDTLVRSLIADSDKLSGANQDSWDGKNDAPISTFVPDGYYYARISAKDAADNSAVTKDVYDILIDNAAPIIDPMSDILTNIPVNLSGSATDPVSVGGTSSGVASYVWEQVSGPGTMIFNVPNYPATMASADIDGTYEIKLTAWDAAGNSDTKTIKFTWDTTVSPVTDLYSITGDGVVDLHWVNPADGDFNGVKIYRSTVLGELGTEIAVLDKTKINYPDVNVLNGVTYYYTVVATDQLGNQNASLQLAITPIPSVSGVVLTPLSSSLLPTGGPEDSGLKDTTQNQGEVKAGESPKQEEQKKDEGNKDQNSLPTFGIAILVILGLVGLYLLYLQNPESFAWLLFWKKKK